MNSSITELSLHIIILRIFLSTIIGGIIGYERGSNNQAAGFRTHILVCLGATIVSLIQEQLRINLLNSALENPLIIQVTKTDLGRIGAQVVSGIGFLGAGAIIREEKSIVGLTTAASVWVTGCIGLGIGWGFYKLTILAGIVVLIVLTTLKKIEVVVKTIAISYLDTNDLNKNIDETFEILNNCNIKIKTLKKNTSLHKVMYTIVLSKKTDRAEIINKLSALENILEIHVF